MKHKTSILALSALALTLAACGTNNAPERVTVKTKLNPKTGATSVDTDFTKDNNPKYVLDWTIPAKAKPSTLKLDKRIIEIPGNASVNPVKLKITVYDPLVVQLPGDWNLVGGSYETKAGAGSLTLSTKPIPSMVTIDKAGQMKTTSYFKAESGRKLYLVDMPEAHKVGGRIKVRFTIEAPKPARRIDTVKFIQTWTVRSTTGALCYYAALDVGDDFAKLTSPYHAWTYDLTGPQCVGPRGNAPSFELTGSSWRIGATSTVQAIDLDPRLPSSLVLGARSNFALPLGTFGCKLRVLPLAVVPIKPDASGRASLRIPVPAHVSLVGSGFDFQPFQAIGNDGILGSVLTIHIQR